MRKALRDHDGSCERRRSEEDEEAKADERSRASSRSSEVISIQAVATVRK
jgi:hypothetical protein